MRTLPKENPTSSSSSYFDEVSFVSSVLEGGIVVIFVVDIFSGLTVVVFSALLDPGVLGAIVLLSMKDVVLVGEVLLAFSVGLSKICSLVVLISVDNKFCGVVVFFKCNVCIKISLFSFFIAVFMFVFSILVLAGSGGADVVSCSVKKYLIFRL